MNFAQPFTMDVWINLWMPYIRKNLNLIADDYSTIEFWISEGLDNSSNIIGLSKNKTLCVAPGEPIETHFKEINVDTLKDFNILAADGAAFYLFENNIKPNVIFTDLDGISVRVIDEAIDKEISIFVLAHGDNLEKLKKLKSTLISYEKTTWCTQGPIISNWINTKGFTDGDRMVCFAVDQKTVPLLVGFDLKSGFRGRYSKPPYKQATVADDLKQKKMKIAWEILKWINNHYQIYTLDTMGSPGLEISFSQFPTIDKI